MNLILGFIAVVALFVFVFFIVKSDDYDKFDRYEYIKEKDEHGNIIEKVLDRKDTEQQPNKTH